MVGTLVKTLWQIRIATSSRDRQKGACSIGLIILRKLNWRYKKKKKVIIELFHSASMLLQTQGLFIHAYSLL
jgi:hypothetical protein